MPELSLVVFDMDGTLVDSTAVVEQVLAEFADRYADQNERDYQALRRAVDDGRVAAIDE